MLFECPYEANGYCYMFGCPSKATEYGCSGSRNSCTNLKFLYDYSTMEIKDIQRRERAAAEQAEKAKKSQKSKSKANYAAKAKLEQLESENARLQNELRQKELQKKREQAAQQGIRIDQDIRYSKTRNRFVCVIIGIFLMFRFVTAGHSFLSIGKHNGDFWALLKAVLLSLPVCLMTLGIKAYGKDEFMGKIFRGSAFIRTYLATLLPCIIGLIAMWSLIDILFNQKHSFGSFMISLIVYLVLCLIAWALNHSSMKEIWKGGLGYYAKQGRK